MKAHERNTMLASSRQPFFVKFISKTATLAMLCSVATSFSPRAVFDSPTCHPNRFDSGLFSTVGPSSVHEGDEQDDFWGEDDLEVLTGDGLDFNDDDDNMLEDTDEDWLPDATKDQRRRPHKQRGPIPANEVISQDTETKSTGGIDANASNPTATPYTEEEQELIDAMGGNSQSQSSRLREEGFLGDSTLVEIASDYSVPICYLADVLCMWGVPVPIDVHDRLGDLVTGEQAFALVEAVNSLDVAILHDRYSNQNLLQICHEWEIDMSEAFQFAMKEGWSLPFGVRTNLRIEQEEELLRVFSRLYQS